QDDVTSSPSRDLLFRPRDHVEKLLRLQDTKEDTSYEEIQKELLQIYQNSVVPLESLYNFEDLSWGFLSESQISAKPIVLFLGSWSTGKSTMINYLLNLENSPVQLHTGMMKSEPTTTEFTVLSYGGQFKATDGKILSSNPQFSELEKFGMPFLERLKGVELPRALLERVTLVDTPGTIENRVQQERGYAYEEAMKWFINKASLIFLLFDPYRLDVGRELEGTLRLLQGKESKLKIVLNKADNVKTQELMRVYGTLLWNMAPLTKIVEPPRIYIGSFWGLEPKSQSDHELLLAEEKSLVRDLHQVMINAGENVISLVRKHARMVLIHAAVVDRYLEVFNKERSIFGDNEAKWNDIVSNPNKYNIFEYFARAPWSISLSDLPPTQLYEKFFKLHKITKFYPLSSHCRFLWGCPEDKIKEAISYILPKLLTRHQQLSGSNHCENDSCLS
ncbi:hypothetical protein HELRODRAFT_76627, partial [Helobdella robusta]|uniref:Dynamin-type G domain-containing protein n=1 Tax=Helobdella robusta TaxID=6412 RepID=T1G2M3_HELRO